MSSLGACPVERGFTAIARDYRDVIRESRAPIVQACVNCNAAYWPPRLRCSCGAGDLHWFPAGPTGRIVSTVGVKIDPNQVIERMVPRQFVDRLPYTTVVVEPLDWANVRMMFLADGLELTNSETGATVALSAEAIDEKTVTLIATAEKG